LAIDSTMLYAGTWYGGVFALQHRARTSRALSAMGLRTAHEAIDKKG